MASPFVELEVDTPSGERTVKVTNPEKTYFSGLPEGRGRKLDLVEYYLSVADGIVRALRERPTVLKRHPGGAQTEAIYQKRVPDNRPPWIETVTVAFPSGRSATELCPVDVAHVAWAANTGCLDFHPWPSRRADVEKPDELRIDLDPMPGTGWAEVVQTALELRTLLDELGMVSFPKTSGSKGIHVYVRIRPEWSVTDVRHCAVAVARELERRRPDLATARWWKEERGERVFVDYNRMARDQTRRQRRELGPVQAQTAVRKASHVSHEAGDVRLHSLRKRRLCVKCEPLALRQRLSSVRAVACERPELADLPAAKRRSGRLTGGGSRRRSARRTSQQGDLQLLGQLCCKSARTAQGCASLAADSS